MYTDGTKIESAANRYTFVWGKSIKTSKDRIKTQLDDLWKYAQGVAAQELKDPFSSEFEQVNAEQMRKTIAKIDQALQDKEVDKKVKQKLNYGRRTWIGMSSRKNNSARVTVCPKQIRMLPSCE